MAFTRTPSGLAEKWRFHEIPTIWIEGDTDLYFYEPISHGLSCRFEPFHGYKNAQALIDALRAKNYPYLVILDGDYSILKRSRSPHRRVIRLPRYSYENLLWEPEAINKACLRHARCGDSKDLVKKEMSATVRSLKTDIHPALVLDVAARRMDSPPSVLPERVDRLLIKSQTRVDFEPAELKKLIHAAKHEVDADLAKEARREINAFLRERCISHLIPGHFLFGLLRRIFVQAADRERGAKSMSADGALLQLLSDAVWEFCTDGDHQRLKRNFRSKLREAVALFP